MHLNLGVFILVWESLTVGAAVAIKVATLQPPSVDMTVTAAAWTLPLALIATFLTCRCLDGLDQPSSPPGSGISASPGPRPDAPDEGMADSRYAGVLAPHGLELRGGRPAVTAIPWSRPGVRALPSP